MKSLGILQSKDQAASAVGAFWSPNSIDPKNMTRSYARSAYYDGFTRRENLHVYTSQHVTKLLVGKGEDEGHGGEREEGKGVKIIGVEVGMAGLPETQD
jgi:hypothetical protein